MTLITLVNKKLESIIPIIYEFKQEISQHIIIHDNSFIEKELANKLQTNIKQLNSKYMLKSNLELIEIDEDSKSDIIHLQKRLSTQLKNQNIYLNATDADVALIVVLSGFVIHQGGKIISYDKFENSYNLIDKNGFTNHKITDNLNIDNFLLLFGYEFSEKDTQQIFHKKDLLIDLFQDTKRVFKIRNQIKRGTINNDDLIIKTLNKLSNIDNINYLSYSTIHYFGLLFEEYLYLILSQYNFDDIKIGVTVVFDKDDNNHPLTNEFDIFAIKDNHIFIIESKFADNLDSLSIIYKSDSILGYFGEDSKTLIVNIQKHNPNNLKNFNTGNRFRAENNNISIFNEFDFGKNKFDILLKQFFGVQKRVFLLGGYDLEMVEIKKIFEKYHQNYLDHKLTWGAKLSSYKNEFNQKNLFIGIELIEDTEPPKNYMLIDHHNNLQDKKSSIEQIANILKIKLTRFQQLVARNDSGYIPAMKQFGANKEEIANIRKEDRNHQGVTQEDEKLADLSIENMEVFNDILIINAKTDKFSPIIDKLYNKNVLIYTDKKLNYYGRDIKKLVSHFEDMIKKNQAYFGGNFGFFGISSDYFHSENIIVFKDEILKLLNT